MIPRLYSLALIVGLTLAHPQYGPSEVEIGASVQSQCGHPSYDCVPYYQCDNGVINTDGEGRIDIRTHLPTSTCVNPDYADVPNLCCLIPGHSATPKPLDFCPANHECTDNARCSHGDGNLENQQTCYKADESLGVCCEQPPAGVEHCPNDQECVPWSNCVNGVVISGTQKENSVKPSNYDSLKCGLDGSMCCAPSSLPPFAGAKDNEDEVIPLSSQCEHPSYDCVPYFQCVKGIINTDGEHLIDIRLGPQEPENKPEICGHPDYPDVPGVCCLIPGKPPATPPVDICPVNSECVDKIQCYGEAIGVDIRTSYQTCHTYENKLGVCCDAPSSEVIDHCPASSACVDHSTCVGQALDGNNNFVKYSKDGKWPECSLQQHDKNGICCIVSPPPVNPDILHVCPPNSYCTENFLCLGKALDYSKQFVEYTFEGIWTQCHIDGSDAVLSNKDEPGVCCIQPPSKLSICPSNSGCVQHSSCLGDALNDAGVFVKYDASLYSWSHCNLGEFDTGLCCINPVKKPLQPAATCGIRNYPIDERIQSNYAENEAAFGEFPWQSIIFFTNYTFKCGGSLISNRHVLTAAHCVHNLLPSDLKIRFGEWQVNSFEEPQPYQDYNVYKISFHPDFNPKNVHNDVAVLEMEHSIELHYHINTICLPPLEHKFTNGEPCITTGWGKDSFKGTFQHIVKKIGLPYIDRGTCEILLRKTRLGKYFKLNQSFSCAGGEENKDACFGDGGGPLICKDQLSGNYVLAGITSWGIECGLKDVPGVYANVQLFTPWIDNIVHGFNKQQELKGEAEVVGYGK